MDNKILLKTITVIVTMENNIERKIKLLVPISTEPYYTYKLTWSNKIIDIDGIVTGIQIKDGKNIISCVLKSPIDIEFGQDINIEWPNEDFYKIAKVTNVVAVSFCIDELPKNLLNHLKWLLSGNTGVHDIKLLYKEKGYYIDQED